VTHRKSSTTAEPFVAIGLRRAEFFDHSVAVIPKQYPATFLLFEQRGVSEAELKEGVFYQLNLYSTNLSGFPDELFTDRTVNWHNQQLGEKGLIAAAGLYAQGSSLTISLLQSDLCQQIYRHGELKRACKTQIGKRFGAWHRILFNAVLDFASDKDFSFIYTPTADWILSSTKKQVNPALFRRIYDSVVSPYERRRVTRARAEYWEIPVAGNKDRVARLVLADVPHCETDPGTLICIFHDVEENVDTEVSPSECRENLAEMLQIEKSIGVRATYNVLGMHFRPKRREIENSDPGHCLAFHSFNHDLNDETQLARCRQIDLQVKGYRPPQSVITPELTDYRLSYFDFEWLASGERSICSSACKLQNGIVKIPVFTDDYPLFTAQQDYSSWERRLIERVQSHSFVAFGLHDCYGRMWLREYATLLKKLGSLGTFVTADDVCDRIYRQHEVSSSQSQPELRSD